MNNTLKEFLEQLSDQEAKDIWGWLDENPSAVEEMIKVTVDSHPNIFVPS